MIFDEDRDGPEIRKLYESKSLEDILAKIEDIQEDKEVFEEDGEEIELGENKWFFSVIYEGFNDFLLKNKTSTKR